MIVVQQGLHIFNGVQFREHIRSGNMRSANERSTGRFTVRTVCGDRHRAERHAVECTHERKDIRAAFCFSGDFQRRFDRICSGGTREHDLIVQSTRLKHFFFHELNQFSFGSGHHIQPVHNAVCLQIFDHFAFNVLVIMSIIQSTGTIEKIDKAISVAVCDNRSLCRREDGRKITAIRTYFRLIGLEDFLLVHHNQ